MSQFTVGLAVLLAVMGSFGLAAGAVGQHRAVAGLGDGRTLTVRQMVALLTDPRWLAGLVAIGAGTLANLTALVLAPVTVIQPIGVLAIVWSVLLAARIQRSRPTGAIWRAVLATLLGLTGFTVLSASSAGAQPQPPHLMLAAIAAGCLGCLGLVLATAPRAAALRGHRSGCLALSGAVFYGLTAALVKLASTLFSTGSPILSAPVLLSAAGAATACLIGGAMVQQAYAGGRAEVVVATLTTVDPMVAVGFGIIALGEGARIGPAAAAGMVVCGMGAVAGVLKLSRHHPLAVEPSAPAPLTATRARLVAVRDGGTASEGDDRESPPASNDDRPRLAVAVVSDYSLATLGGAENAFAGQVRALRETADVLAVCPASRRLEELGRLPGVRVLSVPVALTLPGLGLPVARNTARLRAMLRDAFAAHRIDVVHVHSEFGIASAAVDAAHQLGIPTVETVHTFFWQAGGPVQRPLNLLGPAFHGFVTGLESTAEPLADRPGDSALRNMTLTCALRADRVVSPSAHQAERLRAAGLPRVDVLPNTVDPDPDAEPIGQVDGPLRVLWIGRFAPEKRVLPFIEAALKALDAVGPERLRIDLVGSGPQFRRAVRMVDGRRGIRLVGRVDNTEIPALLAECHVTVLSSVGWDNQPMTVAESLTALRPVIWCDPALTEGVIEAGIPAFGEGALAERLIGLALDPAPIISASEDCIRARRVFAAEHFTPTLLDIYRRAGAASTTIELEQVS
ncbi:MAG: glycosyltransferase [Acidipropionibacterium sp.]|jgi:glycosyltransferase involved in cell wall biosynthesis/drug/metabolite transporter (DMT)-like permease|nr:glycosyltransferase [Acidipropionibacterium sp.]